MKVQYAASIDSKVFRQKHFMSSQLSITFTIVCRGEHLLSLSTPIHHLPPLISRASLLTLLKAFPQKRAFHHLGDVSLTREDK
jgi:hypothetical protein